MIPRRKPRVKPNPLQMMLPAWAITDRAREDVQRQRAAVAALKAGDLVVAEVEAIDGKRRWRVSSFHGKRSDGNSQFWATYYVAFDGDAYRCSNQWCKRYEAMGVLCKHVWSAVLSQDEG